MHAPESMPPALPAGAELLALERQARHQGSGLSAAQLEGTWQLVQVWPKGARDPATLSSAALRALQARLILSSEGVEASAGSLAITNQVRWAGLVLSFSGHASLQGRRPLLWFAFQQLRLSWGERLLLQRTLGAPAPEQRPFFALIGSGPTDSGSTEPGTTEGVRWLAARGRGGGLALWQRQPG